MRITRRIGFMVWALGLMLACASESKAQAILNPRIGQSVVGAAHHRNHNRAMAMNYRGGMGTSVAGYASMGMNRGGQGQGAQRVARELMMARSLLQRGDHDYNGHRARAVKDINYALAALGHGNNGGMNGMSGARPSGNGANGANGARREPQAVSDGQLRQAIQMLNTVQTQLSSSGNSQHARVRVPVQRAMAELNTALTIR